MGNIHPQRRKELWEEVPDWGKYYTAEWRSPRTKELDRHGGVELDVSISSVVPRMETDYLFAHILQGLLGPLWLAETVLQRVSTFWKSVGQAAGEDTRMLLALLIPRADGEGPTSVVKGRIWTQYINSISSVEVGRSY